MGRNPDEYPPYGYHGEKKPMTYGITKVFRSLQGEGHFVGYPMTFVRLGGCSVTKCSIRTRCDEAPWKVKVNMETDAIVDLCQGLSLSGAVCITGGEPSDWDLVPLISALRDKGYRVHLETSGEFLLEGIPVDWLTVSPKTTGYKQRTGHALKIVVRPGMDWGEIGMLTWKTNFFHRYLQPLTAEDGTTNLAEVKRLLMNASNVGGEWALSTQAHKSWGMG